MRDRHDNREARSRGVDDPDVAREYLRPNLGSLGDPFLFTHMGRAVARVQQAVRNGEKILIHGDYDVDGVTGTVLLVKFFALMSAASDSMVKRLYETRYARIRRR